MSTSDGGGEGATRRRSREEAREEILAVVERLLWERPLRDLTVADVMERTQIGRSAFYVYFHDRFHLVTALLQRLESELLAAAEPWLRGPGDSDPLVDVRLALEATVAVWARHGPVLRAIAEAAGQDHDVEAVYRGGLIEHFIVAVSKRIERGQAVGRIRPLDARETAVALILLNERYLSDRMGRPPQAPMDKTVQVLYDIWSGVLYPPPSRSRRRRPSSPQ